MFELKLGVETTISNGCGEMRRTRRISARPMVPNRSPPCWGLLSVPVVNHPARTSWESARSNSAFYLKIFSTNKTSVGQTHPRVLGLCSLFRDLALAKYFGEGASSGKSP